ncbi:MAG: Hsp70 family protein [Verrucomicrobiota bacterium]|nr:Hsp70 family protein [Verrucomicrobiota bacterium]
MNDYIYGIDFGTSNSAVTILNQATNQLVSDPRISTVVPSLMYFPQAVDLRKRCVIGQEAIDGYIREGMAGRLLQAIKTVLSDPSFHGTYINGNLYQIEDLASMIIRFLKGKADTVTGQDVKRAVFGRPVIFNSDPVRDQLAEDRLMAAARASGFTEIHFQYEPIAAALTYEATLTKPEIVLVGDFGGGTSDFTIMRLSPEASHKLDRDSDILATGGIDIAGNKFDSQIMWDKITPLLGRTATYKDYMSTQVLPAANWAHNDICRWENFPYLAADQRIMAVLEKMVQRSDNPAGFKMMIELINQNLGFALFQEIEHGKIELSTKGGSMIRFQKPRIDLQAGLNRAGFTELASVILGKLSDTISQTIKDAGLTDDQIDAVFLTGGTSQSFAVRRIFTQRFGEERLRSLDNFLSVSRGLALSAPLFFG